VVLKVAALASAAKKRQRGGAPPPSELSLVLHIATLGKKSALSEPTISPGATGDSPLASLTGTNQATGAFAVSVFAPRGAVGQVTYFGAKHKREHVEQADDVLKNVYRYFHQVSIRSTQHAIRNQPHTRRSTPYATSHTQDAARDMPNVIP